MDMLRLVVSMCAAVLAAMVVMLINRVVAEPYMDEVFHVDQVRHYCARNYSYWNHKITTPPALYLYSVVVVESMSTALPRLRWRLCSVGVLRLGNAVVLGAHVFHLYGFVRRRSEGASAARVGLAALNCALLPVLFFSSLLYYTDALSVASVAAMLSLHAADRHSAAAVAGCVAVLARQTNVVWLLFCAALVAVERLAVHLAKRGDWRGRPQDVALRVLLVEFLKLTIAHPVGALRLTVAAVGGAAPYLLVLTVCAAVAAFNGGIALGDRSAHEVVLHFPQLLYLFAFTLGFGAPHLFRPRQWLRAIRAADRQSLVVVAVIGLLTAAAVNSFTFDHPYLLADNRHFTFYIWRRYFMRHWIAKFLPIPVYVGAALAVNDSLKGQPQVWRAGALLACALATVPHRLLELRYFIVPYTVWRMHLPLQHQTRRRLIAETVAFLLVNGATIALFLLRPFVWAHEPLAVQRFMW